jgi:hypothetical protein
VLDVDPFDEPNVAEAKEATRKLLERFLEAGRLPEPPSLVARQDTRIAAPSRVAERLRPLLSDPRDPFAWAAALPGCLGRGDYFAILPFFHPTPSRHAALQHVRDGVRRSTRAATTLGYGPRYLHSTGQLHKGGADKGVFLQIVGQEGDRPIPGVGYGFRALRDAQALGDYEILVQRGRRVLRLELGDEIDAGLDRLAEALAASRR